MSASLAAPPLAAVPSPGDRRIVSSPGTQPASGTPRPSPGARLRAVGRRGRWALGAVFVLAAATAATEGWRVSHATTTVHYLTAPVTRGSVTRTVTASGSVNPVVTIQVGTYVSGVIQKLYCDYNTPVRKGQLCAKIDPRPYQTVVDQDRANLSTARAQLAKDQTSLSYAKLTLDRTSGLRDRGIVSEDTLDSAKSTYDQIASEVALDTSTIEQHQAVLKAAEINLAYTDILSPVDGTVVSRSVEMGQTVAASFQTPTLFLIATDLTKMQVDANVSESDIGGIAVGNKARFTVEAFPSHVFAGDVTQVRQAPQTVQNVVTYDVVISVPNPDLLLKPGMTATAHIVVDRRDNVLRVPGPALRYAPGGLSGAPGGSAGATAAGRTVALTRVWVLRDGRPTSVPITIGLDDDTNAEVVSGELKVGDELVTSEQGGGGSTAARPLSFRL